MSCIALHVIRIFGWRLANIKPSEKEAKVLDSNNTPNVMQSYLVWRRSSMFLSLPVMLYVAISGFINLSSVIRDTDAAEILTRTGIFLYMLPNLADAALFLGVIAALCYWKEWHKTSRLLKYGWLASTLLPLIPALFPVDFILHDPHGVITKVEIYIFRVMFALQYAFWLLPLILTFPASCVRAALRIRGLIPDSSFSSWILTIAAPFQSLLVLVALVIIIQIMGNWILISGAFLMCLAPWMYVFRRNIYISASNDDNEKKIDRNQKIIMCMNISSLFLLVIWAHTFTLKGVPQFVVVDESGSAIYYEVDYQVLGRDIANDSVRFLFTYARLFQFLFEYIGRLLVSTVVFGDTILCMTVENFWHNHSRHTSKRIQDTFKSLESITNRKLAASVEGDVESQDSTPDAEGGICMFNDVDLST